MTAYQTRQKIQYESNSEEDHSMLTEVLAKTAIFFSASPILPLKEVIEAYDFI